MKLKTGLIALVVLAMLSIAQNAAAYEHISERPAQAASKPVANAKKSLIKRDESRKKVNIKLVDINSANKAALMKLPGITADVADKIIAGRAYGSKTWLVSDKVIEPTTYGAIKELIVAKQPYKDAAKNAALYKNRQPK